MKNKIGILVIVTIISLVYMTVEIYASSIMSENPKIGNSTDNERLGKTETCLVDNRILIGWLFGDYSTIQGCLDSSLCSSGCEIKVRKGTYNLDAQLEVQGYVTIKGEGELLTVIQANGNFPAINITGNFVKLDSMRIKGNSTFGTNSDCIYAKNVAGLRFQNLRLTHCTKGIHLISTAWEDWFENVYIETVVDGLVGEEDSSNPTKSINFHYKNGWILNPTQDGIRLQNLNSILIDSVMVMNPTRYGFYSDSTLGGINRIINSDFDSADNISVFITKRTGKTSTQYMFEKCYTGVSSGGFQGIRIDNTTHVKTVFLCCNY